MKKLLNEDKIIDFDYSWSYLQSPEKYKIKQNNFQICKNLLVFSLKQIVKDIYCLFKNENIKNKTIFYYSSINQYNALLPIKNKINKSVWLSISHRAENKIYTSIGGLFSFVYLRHFFALLNKSSNQNLLRTGNYYLIEGMYKWWIIYLKHKKPKAIVFSNDHLVLHRILRAAAQINNIPTIYIQHASVTEKFPKLEFDLSLLEGQDALDKYAKKGINGKVELIGMPKFDKYFPDINTSQEVHSIGICTNILDDENYIETLCSDLRYAFPQINIMLRPHPGDSRFEFYQSLILKYKMRFSNSKYENSFDYLKKVDINIAGETSIHLEAVLMNVYPIYFQFQKSKFDHYGYLKNKLVVDIFDDTEKLNNFLNTLQNNKPQIRDKAKYYVDTVNSEHDGKSVEKAMKHIQRVKTAFQ